MIFVLFKGFHDFQRSPCFPEDYMRQRGKRNPLLPWELLIAEQVGGFSMTSSDIHAFQKIPWHPCFVQDFMVSCDDPCLVQEFMVFPATIHALRRMTWDWQWHEEESAMGSGTEVLGSPRSKASTAHGKSLHRFKLDGTAWQYHPSHLNPCKPGLGGRRDWRGRRRTRKGGWGGRGWEGGSQGINPPTWAMRISMSSSLNGSQLLSTDAGTFPEKCLGEPTTCSHITNKPTSSSHVT